jgi:hypothetical protein
MMGVFPLADTSIRCSDAFRSRGHARAGANGWAADGWINDDWWYPDPTTPRRAAIAIHSPTDSFIPSDLIMRCVGIERIAREEREDPVGPCRTYIVSDRIRSSRVGRSNGLQ